jgi:3',5'-cyclic AMP phosphodiesterase CpdA
MKKKQYVNYVLSIIIVSFVLCFYLPTNASAVSLYEQSLEKLQKQAAHASAKDFSFVVLGDSRDNDSVFIKLLLLAAVQRPLFILHTGDISNRSTVRELDHFLEMVHQTVPAIPFFVVPGNHETDYNTKVFKQKIGPLDYVLDIPRLESRIIVLDNSGYALEPPQLSYVRDQLHNRRTFNIVSMHIPPKTDRWRWHAFSKGAAQLIQILSDNKVSLAFFGHIHQFDQDIINGIPYIITGGAGAPLNWFFFPGKPVYHIIVVKIKNGSIVYEMVTVND